MEPDYTIIKGDINCIDTTKKITYGDVFITVTNIKSGEVFGNYTPNPYSGRYVIIVPPGQYSLTTETSGFLPLNEKINVLDKASFKKEINKDLILKPEGWIDPNAQKEIPKKDPKQPVKK